MGSMWTSPNLKVPDLSLVQGEEERPADEEISENEAGEVEVGEDGGSRRAGEESGRTEVEGDRSGKSRKLM